LSQRNVQEQDGYPIAIPEYIFIYAARRCFALKES